LSSYNTFYLFGGFLDFISQIHYTVLKINSFLCYHFLQELNESCNLINFDIINQDQHVGIACNSTFFFYQLFCTDEKSPFIKYFWDLFLDNRFGELAIWYPIWEWGLEAWLQLTVPVLSYNNISCLVLFSIKFNTGILYIFFFLHVFDDNINQLWDVLSDCLYCVDARLLPYKYSHSLNVFQLFCDLFDSFLGL